jgi:hypothetical protein
MINKISIVWDDGHKKQLVMQKFLPGTVGFFLDSGVQQFLVQSIAYFQRGHF